MPMTKKSFKSEKERLAFEFDLTKEFALNKDDTKSDLLMRVNGVATKRGASGYQFAGYTTLEQFYRGDQWDHNEPPGAAQRTDNYCAVIVDNLSSLIFDDDAEINCPTDDPTDDILEMKAEIKEKLLWKVWEENDYKIEFDELAKVGSLYGDTFIKGPWMEEEEGKWKIKFSHIENPGSVRLVYADTNYKKIIGYIQSNRISLVKAMILYGEAARAKGITLATSLRSNSEGQWDTGTSIPMVNIDEYGTKDKIATFVNDKVLDYYFHNWGFVPMIHIKNTHSPNYPYGKSDLEDVLDPQLSHNRTNNDLANLLKWVSTVNMWGKNLEGMQALVAGLSRIYSVPEDGELHTFERMGDAYITNTYAQQRRSAIVEISGVSESLMSSSQVANASGRALALAFQGTIRKLKPRIKRYETALQEMNRNILKLYEIYFPVTKKIIMGDYRNKVYLPTTLLRNIIDTINKFQSGLISQDTAMREAGVAQPKMEQKLMKKNLMDPILGPQTARQPSLLPRLTEGQNQGGENPMPQPGNQPAASQAGAVAAGNQQASGAAPTPVE